MLSLRKLAITGTLGSGKSTALKQFEKLGAASLDCDQYVHDLLKHNQNVINQVKKLFGNQVITNETLDRKKIANIVFGDETSLKQLEDILYPEIKKWLTAQYEKAIQSKKPLFVVEVPLLFEANWQKDFDVIIAISADKSLCQKRFSLGNEEYERRKKFHIPNKEKFCDIVIDNNGDEQVLEKQIQKLFTQLTSNQKS